jgi:acetyl-CoA C-acetyltransferase
MGGRCCTAGVTARFLKPSAQGNHLTEAYIVAAARTAGGRREGRLSGWHPADLAAEILNALLDRSGVPPELVDDVIVGCVGQVGEQSNNVARNAVLASRLPESVPATTVDRQCGSSQQAVHFAAQAVMSGTMDIVIAAGVESMTRVPMSLPATLAEKHGYGTYVSPGIVKRYSHVEFSQFAGAEMLAKKYNLAKETLDEYAYLSHQRAIAATRTGKFKAEIVAVEARGAGGIVLGGQHDVDEGIRFDVSMEGIRKVNPIVKDGRLTAASASQICDGASGVLVANEKGLKMMSVSPLARVHQLSVLGHDPVIMLEAPIPATQLALKKAGLTISDIGLFEVNEAFAPVPLAWLQATHADPTSLNVNGGAISLGHPLGSSGTKLLTTLLYALLDSNTRYGLQTMCEGGGLANVTIVERF